MGVRWPPDQLTVELDALLLNADVGVLAVDEFQSAKVDRTPRLEQLALFSQNRQPAGEGGRGRANGAACFDRGARHSAQTEGKLRCP